MALSALRAGLRRLAVSGSSPPQILAAATVSRPTAVVSAAGLPHLRGFAAAVEGLEQSPLGADVAALTSGEGSDLRVPLYNWKREEVGTTLLAGAVFNVEVRKDILYRVVRWQLARRQQGTHSTKTRSAARGGGRKPWKQKGTGRARAGTIRAPHWRGGGVAHGPLPRSHEHDLQRKVRRQGLACALSAKAAEGRLLVLDTLALPDGKTRLLDEALDALLADYPRRSVLFIDSGKTAADGGLVIRRAAANLPWVDVLPQEGANVYSILQRDVLVLTQAAAAAVAERTLATVHRTPARLRDGSELEPMLHPAVREQLAARAAVGERLAARIALRNSLL